MQYINKSIKSPVVFYLCACKQKTSLGEIAVDFCEQTVKMANSKFCQRFGTDFCALRDAQIKYTDTLVKQFKHLLTKTDAQKEVEVLFSKWSKFRQKQFVVNL